MAANKQSNKGGKRIPALEWGSAALGLVILTVLFGFLAYEAVKSKDGTPPLMMVEVTDVVAYSDRFVVEVKVINRSRTTGAGVGIEGTLIEGATTVETSEATVDYVPGMSQRQGGLIFTRDPRDYRLELRVTGFELP